MAELLSVGLDVGTTTSQMILSRLRTENKASAFSVPELSITDRQVIYRGPVRFTPLLNEQLVDANKLKELVAEDYRAAGITPEQVDTGAIIITGETSRKENAAAVLKSLSSFAGNFVVATAGPDLESILAARGAGATDYSSTTGERVLHMDIGGGTTNLCLIEDGHIIRTGCFNVGGRLLKRSPEGVVTYLSPVLRELTDIPTGQIPTHPQIAALTALLTQTLAQAAGLAPETGLLRLLETGEVQTPWQIPKQPLTISFSGGVTCCIEKDFPPNAFGDIGPELGQAIRTSPLFGGKTFLPEEAIRATVIGAGCHSVTLSGSTVYLREVSLPMQNLPVTVFSQEEQEDPNLSEKIRCVLTEEDRVLAFPGFSAPDHSRVRRLAERIAGSETPRPLYLCVQQDMAKALGQALALLLPGKPILCIDRVWLEEGSYLDIGAPVGPALPVVVKTLILSH
ncbi:MAG: ethanolamine ammonia-lyase reactivating factor EutA [Oscillospiraceae bacterium]|nr:ethanolamine ammonia-lyase reactivating factor EutA [Oscillospiraceae bacterium]